MKVTEWLEEINSAKKREKHYRKMGQEILDIYENDKGTGTESQYTASVPFNILYSNTETLSPALFSQVPRPVVTRRFKDEDPLGRFVSEASQRMLEYLIDTDVEDYDPFESSMADATLDGLLPGRGWTTVKYESDDAVEWETACTDTRKWDRVFFGFAHKWKKVPWIAYEEYLDKAEAKKLFGSKINKLKFTSGEESDKNDDNVENEDKGEKKTTLIYQIWDKSDKTIKYISPQNKDDFMKVDDDPLGLVGFYNCPEPIRFVRKSNNLSPTALYTLYENQAKELNNIQSRLNRVIEAIKVRGAYNGALGEEIEQILKEEDNALVPTDKAAGLMEGGFDKNIWFLPIQELMQVAQALIQARESAKHVIYEITGISDIVRGQSVASETLGAQKIKESWGTMRLKTLQKEVQRFVLDTMKIMLDIAANKFSEQSWVKMTGLPYATSEQVEQAQNMMQAVQQANPQDPKVQQVMQQAQGILNGPKWPDILNALKDKFGRSYRIDIETNSTLDVEATEDKQLVGDFMNAMAQFMNGMGPLIEKGVMPFGAAKSMMLAIVKRYRFGREVEDELMAMSEPKKQPDPAQQKAMQEFQQAQQKFEQEKKSVGEKLDQEFAKLEQEKMQLDYDKKLASMEIKYKENLASAKQQMDEAEAQSELKDIVSIHKRDVQSMLDKHKMNVEVCLEKAVNVQN